VKTKSLEKNEDLQNMQKWIFSALDRVLVTEYEWDKFNSQVKSIQEKYKKSLEDYDKIT